MGRKQEGLKMGYRDFANQRGEKLVRDRRKNFSPMDNVVEAISREQRIERSNKEFEEYLLAFEARRDNQGTITIVDFTTQNNGLVA